MKTLDDVKLKDILPYSISHDENVKASAEAIDGQLTNISRELDLPSIYARLDSQPGIVLDHLAVQWDVSVWRESWPKSLKLKVLKNSIAEKRKTGTLSAVKKALESLGSAAKIVEWWQTTPKGIPHTFTVYATQSEIAGTVSAELQEDLFSAIDAAKPVRSHYTFVLANNVTGGIGFHGLARFVNFVTLKGIQPETTEAEVSGTLATVISVRAIKQRRLTAHA
jgi:phage tail P2-like protein